MYDLIGDIHGHADELDRLLATLGYRKRKGTYRHPERQVIFLGDFIDRGPKIRQVLEVVRPMIDEGAALAVMGNHELNALAFHTADPQRPGAYLRQRDNKNIRQHGRTILQLSDQELAEALEWFRTLPLWLDLAGLRVVHACWDEKSMQQIGQVRHGRQRITNAFLQSACRKGNALFDAVEIVLKGKEARLPQGVSFFDKDGHQRHQTRVRWFEAPQGQTYRTYALSDKIDSDVKLDQSLVKKAAPYPATAKPVFVGHYWLAAKRPRVLAANVACVDYSVAKGGFLCAHRWQGEQKLSNDHFVWNAGRQPGRRA